MGADSRFRGLNVASRPRGRGRCRGSRLAVLAGQRGGHRRVGRLEAVAGFGDGTADFTRDRHRQVGRRSLGLEALLRERRPGPLLRPRVPVAAAPVATRRRPSSARSRRTSCCSSTAGTSRRRPRRSCSACRRRRRSKLQSFAAVPGDGVGARSSGGRRRSSHNLGFHVYRGLSADGPWTRLTSSLIPGLGSSAVGQAYSLRDSASSNGVALLLPARGRGRVVEGDVPRPRLGGAGASAAPPPGRRRRRRRARGRAPGRAASRRASCPAWVLAAAPDARRRSSCTRHGDPGGGRSLGPLARARSATLELRTGGFWALQDAVGDGARLRPGFDFPPDPQAPALPLRRALVDAVVGKQVQLARRRRSTCELPGPSCPRRWARRR